MTPSDPARDPLAAALRAGHTATEAELPADHPARSAWGQAALTEIDRLRAAIRDTPATAPDTATIERLRAALEMVLDWQDFDDAFGIEALREEVQHALDATAGSAG